MNVLERTSNEKQAAAIAQQQKDAISSKHSQNLHHGGQQQNNKNGATRKNRESRSKSHEWPEVPDIGKIQENNPELLAQKILETGRQIEAGRIPNRQSGNSNSNSKARLPQASLSFSTSSSISSTQSQTAIANKDTPNRIQEPPRVANFEDRLKSIITSVLNEDQQNRNKQQQMQLQVQLQNQTESERKRVSLTQNVSTPDYTQVSISTDQHGSISFLSLSIFKRFFFLNFKCSLYIHVHVSNI